MTVIALVGSPNCGKTTVFNALTGLRQKVGNWPGVTVERLSGHYNEAQDTREVVDLPGIYHLREDDDDTEDKIDEQVARDFVHNGQYNLILHVLDASSLQSSLYLTAELLATGKPMLVVLNMMDVAKSKNLRIDVQKLSQLLGCPVLPLSANRSLGNLKQMIAQTIDRKNAVGTEPLPAGAAADAAARSKQIYDWVDAVVLQAIAGGGQHQITNRLDALFLNRWLAFPLFLFCMYLIFFLTIHLGGALIDAFDGVAGVFFVATPKWLLTSIGSPDWLAVLLADGVGGGMQLVASFIPIIGVLFLCLAFLEASGYMTRAAFIVDRLMSRLGLPGQSFIPLIVGFGCNVPAVMATRSLSSHQDRLLTTIMAPFMSCGARLTVYALFAAAFFPGALGAQVVFGLYLIGIALAILSGLVIRKFIMGGQASVMLMVMPAYHLPTLRHLFASTWRRLKAFVWRAGKAIVAVVVILNVLNSWGTDGSFGHENSEKSYLSEIGKALTPVFSPMGVTADNWPATVGIFTGIFAKEVVVGTLDTLYGDLQTGSTKQNETGTDTFAPLTMLADAFATLPVNLSGLKAGLTDPLGLQIIGDASDGQLVELNVRTETLSVMQGLFGGHLAVFCYLLFILLYVPCVATMGAIYKEYGYFWMAFSATWSTLIAWCLAVAVYQTGSWWLGEAHQAWFWLPAIMLLMMVGYGGLILAGRRQTANERLIPVVQLRAQLRT